MAKKHKEPPHPLRFFQADDARWFSYDIPDLKIEVMHLDDVWLACGTLDDEYNYYYGQELSESAANRIVAVTALLSQVGLPMMLGLTDNPTATLYDFYPDIEFHWQNKRTGQFEIEPMLPKRNKLDITLHQRNDGSWVWRNALCTIEVMCIESMWCASCDPRAKSKETVKRPSITVEDVTREKALALLLQHEDIACAMGLCYSQQTPLKRIFGVISIRWKEQAQRSIQSTQSREAPKQNMCSWRDRSPYCDGSFNCTFCASSGEAYFMRWDD